MGKINRRNFIHKTFATIAASTFPFSAVSKPDPRQPKDQDVRINQRKAESVPDIIDSNVNLFQWPFRKLKYDNTGLLVKKLRRHRISQAWAGSFEALFHKNIDGVNARLARECQKNGEDMLLPFGTVNLAWPDWEEDVRRCHKVYQMAGIRIYPGYQSFDLGHPDFSRLVRQTADRNLILQISCGMEDARVHHPIIDVRNIKVELLPDILKEVPKAKVQLLYWNHRVGGELLEKLIAETNVILDITRIESCGGVGRLIEGDSWTGNTKPIPAERFIFGSHAPYFPVEANLLKLFASPLSGNQVTAIMRGNADRFLNGK